MYDSLDDKDVFAHSIRDIPYNWQQNLLIQKWHRRAKFRLAEALFVMLIYVPLLLGSLVDAPGFNGLLMALILIAGCIGMAIFIAFDLFRTWMSIPMLFAQWLRREEEVRERELRRDAEIHRARLQEITDLVNQIGAKA